MVALGGDFVVACHLPSDLAGLFVKGCQPRLALMHPGHDNMLVGQHRRGAMVPEQRVLAIGFYQVRLPEDFAIESQCSEHSTLEVDVQGLAVGHRRSVAA